MEPLDQLRTVIADIAGEAHYARTVQAHIQFDLADAILAATYPPACHRTEAHAPGGSWFGASCPDCPTLAQLLAEALAVRRCKIIRPLGEGRGGYVELDGTGYTFTDDVLDAIRAVTP